MDSYCGGEVVGATDRHRERRRLLQRQRPEMTVKSSVTPENQRRIGLVGGIEFITAKDVHARQLEWPDVLLLREE